MESRVNDLKHKVTLLESGEKFTTLKAKGEEQKRTLEQEIVIRNKMCEEIETKINDLERKLTLIERSMSQVHMPEAAMPAAAAVHRGSLGIGSDF